jgi:hypothetical protein
MEADYTITVRLPSGAITKVVIRSHSAGVALEQAQAYGQVIGIVESRYVNPAW